jgi:hypothetical protein
MGCFNFVHKYVSVFCLNGDFLPNIHHSVLSVTLQILERFGMRNQPYSFFCQIDKDDFQ